MKAGGSAKLANLQNNFFQWHFQHTESKTNSFLRPNKVILAFGLLQLIDSKRCFTNFKNYHRTNDRKPDTRRIICDKNKYNSSIKMNFTGLLRITLFLENNYNDSLLFIGYVTKNRKIWTPHHKISFNSLVLRDLKATHVFTCYTSWQNTKLNDIRKLFTKEIIIYRGTKSLLFLYFSLKD